MQIKSRSQRMKNVATQSNSKRKIPLNMRNEENRNNNITRNLTQYQFYPTLHSVVFRRRRLRLLFPFFPLANVTVCLWSWKFLLEFHKEIERLCSFFCSRCLCKPYTAFALYFIIQCYSVMFGSAVVASLCKIDRMDCEGESWRLKRLKKWRICLLFVVAAAAAVI